MSRGTDDVPEAYLTPTGFEAGLDPGFGRATTRRRRGTAGDEVDFEATGYDASSAYLARTRMGLRRAGLRTFAAMVVISIVLGIVEGTAHDDHKRLAWQFPNAWLPRESSALITASAVLLLMSFLVRFLPGGRGAAQSAHFFSRPQWAFSRLRRQQKRLARASGPRSALATGWEVLAGVLAVGLAATIVADYIAGYDPDVHTAVAHVSGPGLVDDITTRTADFGINAEDNFTAARDLDIDDQSLPVDLSRFDGNGTLERMGDAASAQAVVTTWTAQQRRVVPYSHGEMQVFTFDGGAYATQDDSVDLVRASGRDVVELTLYGGDTGDDYAGTSDADVARRVQAAQTFTGGVLADADHVLTAREPWWR